MLSVETESPVTIKGIREGLLVSVKTADPYEDILALLATEISERGSFFRNSRIALDLAGRIVNQDQLGEMQEMFARKGIALWAVLSHREATRSAARDLGLATRLPGSQMDLNGNGGREPADHSTNVRPDTPPNAMFIKETLRSGRSIYYHGHVIIVGDINPGAEVIADGNIVVWGKLYGLVHAGAEGDESATVSALDLSPTQLRIADYITVAPPPDKKRIPIPESASIKEGQIVAEPWH
ncbi:MAG: septum site-determining protein MinC [Chloroflexota bacterium]